MIFQIDDDMKRRIDMWLTTQVYPEIIAQQRDSGEFDTRPFVKDCWDQGYPYTGAIGGGLTYSFSPTSIGMHTKVTFLEHELDLTDYDSW